MARVALKSNLFKLASVQVLMLAAVLIGTLIFNIFYATNIALVIFAVVALLTTIGLVGWQKDKSVVSSDVIQVVAIYVLAYFLIIYLLGLVISFVRNGYGLAPLTILSNIWPVIIVVVAEELLRYSIVKKSAGKKWLLILTAITFIVVDIATGFQAYNLAKPLELFEMIGLLCLVSIARNCLLTFIAYKSSYKPALLFHLVFAITPFVLPIMPDLGPYIGSVVGIFLPTLLLIRLNEFFITKRPIPGRQHKGKILTLVPISTALIVIVVLVSGIFRYYAVAVGSDSMIPEIKTGDAVIIDKDSGLTLGEIEVGTVIAFRHDGETIVHRLIEVRYDGDTAVAQTKGDHNENADGWSVKQDDLVGIVKLRLPLIGWPTVWLERTLAN